MKVNCQNCGKEFDKFPNQIKKHPINYCSRSCAAIINNKRFPKRIKNKPPSGKIYPKKEKVPKIRTRLCDKDTCACGKAKEKRSKTCSTCVTNKSLSRTKIDAIYSHQLNRASKYCRIREHARLIAKKNGLLNQPCAKCGYSKHVEICHVKSISEFSNDSTIGEINDISNLIQLCPNCHWEYDNALILQSY